MGLQQFASVAVVVTAFASDGGALMASQRDSIHPQALYESRAGSIEVFDHGLRIWHVEGKSTSSGSAIRTAHPSM
jgi:hypothetical protein